MVFLKVALCLIISFLLALFIYPFYIKRMIRLKRGQQVREDGPKSHSAKAGTPTMGGTVMLLVACVLALLFSGLSSAAWLIVLVMLGCGLIGFIDDYRKIVSGQSLGLKARAKILGQFIIAAIFVLLLICFGHYDTKVILPVLNSTFDLGLFYPLFIFLVVLSATNAVNITDGLDGLATGISVLVLLAFFFIGWNKNEPAVMLICASLIGAGLGFLVFNRHPARLFMGDVGSLGLGGAVAALAVITKAELFLVIIGGLYVIEALSVIAQVVSFQLTGQRVLLMAPLHHHFELKGWSEWQVVLVFWAVAAVFAGLGTLLFQFA